MQKLTLVAILVFGSSTCVDADLQAAEDQQNTQASVAQWITDLGSSDYSSRKHATASLLRAGQPAVPALTEAVQNDDNEVAIRAVKILLMMTEGSDTATADSAYAALVKLSQSKSADVARRVPQPLERSGIKRLKRLGARVYEKDGHVGVSMGVGCTCVDDDLVHLQSLSSLTSLALSARSLTPDCLQHLSALSKLESLQLGKTVVTDEAMGLVAKLPNLKELKLSASAQFTGKGLAYLAAHPTLEHLNLYSTVITDEHVGLLAEIPHLRILLLPTTCGDGGLQSLVGMQQLENLTVSSSRITDAGCEHIQRLQDLRILDVSQNVISDEGVLKLAALPNLRKILLGQTYVSREGAAVLKKALPSISIRGEVGTHTVTPAHMQAAATIHSFGGKVRPFESPGKTDVWIGKSWRGGEDKLSLLTRLVGVRDVYISIPISREALARLQQAMPDARIWQDVD